MLMDVPLTATVRLRSICVSGGEGGRTPSTVRLFVNREHLDFTGVQEGKPAQEISLSHEDPGAETWHPLKPARFTGVGSLQLHFVGALGGPEVGEEEGTRVYYIGLRGDVVGVKGTAPAVIVYEARPQLADHKVENPEEIVKVGDEIEVKILRVDTEDRKIGLSRKRVEWAEEEEHGEKPKEREHRAALKGGLGEAGPLIAPRPPRGGGSAEQAKETE
jgi:hypothetical protein